MKTLTQAWELIQLLSSLRLLSPTLVRASNPQNYTFYCSYSPEVVNPHKIAGKHVRMCGDLVNCSYYRRITSNRTGGTMGLTIATGVYFGIIEVGATLMAPLTGGASIVAAALLTSVSATGVAVGTGAATIHGMTETLDGIENQLKEKWENKQKDAKINDLQRQLANTKRQLATTIATRDEYRRKCGESNSNYLREKRKVERLENRVRNLKGELCREKGCRCGGNCM